MQDKEKGSFSFINEKIKAKPLNKKRLVSEPCSLWQWRLFSAWFLRLFLHIFSRSLKICCILRRNRWLRFRRTIRRRPRSLYRKAVRRRKQSRRIHRLRAGTPERRRREQKSPNWRLRIFRSFRISSTQSGREANKSIVTVTGVKSDTDWFNNPYESRGQSSGIIVAENGRELLILTERKAITDVQEIYVTFVNDTTVEAAMKMYDGNTGIAILSVPLTGIEESTRSAISTAVLGNSITMAQGTIVIAVGSPLGTNYSVLAGNITSTNNSISTLDSNYTVFTTNIVGSSSGSGALINVDGEVVGLVMQDYSNAEDENTLTAISISELKTIIEMLSNGGGYSVYRS